jgi:hypothetical protein
MLRCCLAFIACAILQPISFAATAQLAPDNTGMDSDAMAQIYTSMGNPGSAARLSDSEASCEQLYAESTYLDARMAAMPKAPDPMEASAKMQEEMLQAQKKMMGGMRAKGVASSLLSMVPGVGSIAGGLASSAMSRGPTLDAMNEVTRKATARMQESTQAMMALSQLQMRNAHVTGLFLSRDCKVSTLDKAAVSASRVRLDQTQGAQSRPEHLEAAPASTGTQAPPTQSGGSAP